MGEKNSRLVSVVVPIYNGEKYIRETVNSITRQKYSNLEILLIDDGSKDNSRRICKTLAETDNRINVIFREKNGGVSECRLTGLDVASGDWLMFVDHDDTIPDDCISTFIDTAENDEEMEIVCGNVSETYIRKTEDSIPIVTSGRDVVMRYYDDPLIKTSHESKLYKTRLLRDADVSKYRTRCPVAFFDDIVITPILLGDAKKVAVLPGVYYLHREVQTSISRSNLLNSFMYDHMEAGDIMLQYFLENECDRSYSHKLSRYIRDILRIYCLMDYFNLSDELRNTYKDKIKYFYKKYKRDYKLLSDEKNFTKRIFLLFDTAPDLWKKIIQHTYYKNYKKEHNL